MMIVSLSQKNCHLVESLEISFFTFKAYPATVRKTKFTVKYIICMRDVFPSSTQVEKRGLQSTTRNCIFLSNQSGHSKGIREGSKMQYLC